MSLYVDADCGHGIEIGDTCCRVCEWRAIEELVKAVRDYKNPAKAERDGKRLKRVFDALEELDKVRDNV